MNDLARIYVKGGNGGNGKVSFRHEKFAPKGGPDGGDGGRGGDVVIVADENIPNLVEFNYTKKFIAKNGEHGLSKKMHGKDSDTLTFSVPVGTVVWELPTDLSDADLRDRATFDQVLASRKLMIDMDTHGKKYIVAYGGKGGRGNDHFKSSVNQTPQEAEDGQPGEEKWLLLEHKVIADVGIIGLPNVGKSSLLKALSRANPKIAGYPFTTLEPNLGVMIRGNKKQENSDQSGRIILVDVPGVVEEAYEGKGIGPWFMRHLERTKVLVHVVAPSINEPFDHLTVESLGEQFVRDYQVVRTEIEKYTSASSVQAGTGLSEKKVIVVANKMELIDEKERKAIAQTFEKKTGKELVWISAGMGEVGELVKKLG